jgi:hypothetical protein
MPFGPTNEPATFINFIYDVNSQWKALATSVGITIDDNTNTRIIVDDIISHGPTVDASLLYMECQLKVCQSYRLSLSLRKSFIFPKQFKFVGNDVSPDGNRPAQTKHQLLESWPKPEIVRDIAKFIGFAQFYSIYIHHFELRIAPLREITIKSEYTDPVSLLWLDAAQRSMDDMKEAILLDPCLMCFNHNRLIVLQTDFSSLGFSYVVCQPGTDASLEAAMVAYRSDSSFAFMIKEAKGVLRPVAFGGRRCRGNKICLHSHLGEGFAGNWAISKNRHMLFGTRFVWVTDCYAIRFILSYDGNNPAVLWLQMRLMCWDVDIVHRNNIHLTDADYWSHLGADICYDPLFKSYLDFDRGLRQKFPVPTKLPMLPVNMPYYRGPRVIPPSHTAEHISNVNYCHSLVSNIMTPNCNGLSHLSIIPVKFGDFDTVTPLDGHASTNHEFPCYAQ